MLSKNIYELRKKLGLTQKELAERAGVTSQSVWGWEQGIYEPKGERLQRLAEALEVDVQSLTDTNHDKNRIQVLGVIPAGIPLEAITDVIDYEDIPAEWSGEYFGLKVHGDSMSPKYLDQDTIIVKVQQTCESGQDCVVRVNGFDATLKTVLIKDGYFELVPYNKKYDVMRFADVVILGVVVEIRRKV